MSGIEVNGRHYQVPSSPIVVVCVDGSAPAYHQAAVAAGRMPYLATLLRSGSDLSSECVMPSLTNPNNVSIMTGVTPATHGICGNYYLDADRGVEVMMNDQVFLRTPTIFAAFEQAGVDVAVVTAKDKLRRLLAAGLEKGPCFSAERAAETTVAGQPVLEFVGRPAPDVYSGALSEFVMAAGVRLLESYQPTLMYLSLSDYVQHTQAPTEPVALDFYAMLDTYLARLDELGAVVVVTADHGMNAKTAADGTPNVVYLQALLDEWVDARVVLPITDPYVAHHAALGSFAFVHVGASAEPAEVVAQLAEHPAVELALGRDEAADRFELPADRIGDVAVVARHNVVFGTSPDRHDLSRLNGPLRSHGGLSEQLVPFLVNRPLPAFPDGHRLRNFDAFWLAATAA